MPAYDTIEEIKSKLDAERAKLIASFAGVRQEDMHRAGDEGSWAIKDILAHVAASETVNVRFAQMMVEQSEPDQLVEFRREYPEYSGEFELNRFNAWMASRQRQASVEEVIAGFHAARAHTLAWLATLTTQQLDRTGIHAVWGEITVRAMFRILAIHDRSHRVDLEKVKTALGVVVSS